MCDSWNALPAAHPRRATRRALFPVLVAAAWGLVGCATEQPFSFLDGARWDKSEMDTYDTLILSVDGHSYSYNDRIRIDPGVHHIWFQTTAATGFTFSPRKELVLDVEPCTRYWFEAKRQNAAQQDFEPRVNYKEHIPGCGVGSTTAATSGSRMGGGY